MDPLTDNEQRPAAATRDAWEEDKSPTKDISKTTGGKLTNWLIDWGIGFFGNGVLSVYVSYYLNPKSYIKDFKQGVLKGISETLNVQNPERQEKVSSGIRSGMEMGFQLLSGTIATLLMTPLVSRREKIAYSINKILGKDTDVLPLESVIPPQPKSVEEMIRQQIDQRVNYKQTPGDLWKARVPVMGAIFVGDQIYNWGNIKMEEKNLQSPDTLIFRAGQQIYKAVPETAGKLNHWFEQHEAGMEDIKKNAPAHYERIKATEVKYGHATPDTLNTDRMAAAEGARLFAKEVGWTFASADSVKHGTEYFRNRRIQKEKLAAIKTLYEQGLIPEGYIVGLTQKGEVIVTQDSPQQAATPPTVTAAADNAPSTRLDLKGQDYSHDQLQPDAQINRPILH